MIKNLEEFDSSKWVTDQEENGVSLKYKFQQGSPSVNISLILSKISILMESIIPVEAIKLIVLVNEVDLYN